MKLSKNEKEKSQKKKRSKWKLKRERTARWKWLKVVYGKIDENKARIEAIETFLGGKDNIDKVNKETEKI